MLEHALTATPLGESWGKFYRAGQLHEQLITERDAWLTAHSEALTLPYIKTYRADRGAFEFRPPPMPAVPWHWPLLIGDVVQNFRSALNFMAWRIVERGTKPHALSSSAAEGIQFPIFWEPNRQKVEPEVLYAKRLQRYLPGVTADIGAVVEAAQPYQWVDRPAMAHPLAMLARLSNVDKHRFLHIAVAVVNDLTVDLDTVTTKNFVWDRSSAADAVGRWDGWITSSLPEAVKLTFFGRATGGGPPDLDVKLTANHDFVTESEGIGFFNALQQIGISVRSLLLEVDRLMQPPASRGP